MSFHEDLILRVANYRELYDSSDRYYNHQPRKEEIWQEIADEIGQTSEVCKDAWKRLRDNYRKAKRFRKDKMGQSSKKIKPIKFERELAFLDPHLPPELRYSHLTISSTDDEANDNSGDNPAQQLTEGISGPATPDSVKNVSKVPKLRLTSRLKRRHEHIQQSPMQEYLQSKREQQVSQQPDVHPLDIFFSAMSATVKTFPAPMQLIIKQKVFELVTDTEATLINSVSPNNTIPRSSLSAVQAETSASPGKPIGPERSLRIENVMSLTPGFSGFAGQIKQEDSF